MNGADALAVEAEQNVLGAVLYSNAAMASIEHELSAEHFLDPVHAEIFRHMQAMVDAGREATPVTLGAFMGEHELLKAEGATYLADICAAVPSALSAPSYAAAVKDAWKVRTLRAACSDGLERLTGPERLGETGAGLEEALERVTTGGRERETSGFVEGAADWLDRVRNPEATDDALKPPSSGIQKLDYVIGSLKPRLYIVAARPSLGKTTLARAFMLNVARQGRGVFFASLEMSKDEQRAPTLTDMARETCKIAYQDLDDAPERLQPEAWPAIEQALAEFRRLPIRMNDRGHQSAGEIARGARQAARIFAERETPLGLVIIDYLQLMRVPQGRDSMTDRIGENVHAMKALQKELGVAVVLVSQLNRAVESREDKMPTLSDLKGSGDIEQDADVVMFPFRAEHYLQREADNKADGSLDNDLAAARGKMRIYVAKQRGGKLGAADVWCDMASSSVRSVAPEILA